MLNRFTRWLSDAYFGPAPVAAAVLIALAVVTAAWPRLRGHATYPDAVAGYIAWHDADKGIDQRAVALLAGTIAVVSVGLGRSFRRVAPDGPASDTGAALNQLLLLSLAPAAWRLTVAALHPDVSLPSIVAMAAFPLGVLGAAVLLGRYRDVRPADVRAGGAAAVLSIAFAAFAAIAFLLAISRLVPSARVGHIIGPAVAGATIVAAVCVIVVWATAPTLAQLRRRLLGGLALWQLPLPLLLFQLVPPPMVDPTRQFTIRYHTLLVGTLAACATVGTWTVWRHRRPAALRRAVAPAAVVALMVFCHCPTVGLPTAERDYFHFGEQVLPWQQLRDFGSRPYVDFVPIHGLMAFVRGGCNQAFFDGTAANFDAADTLLDALATAAIAGAACLLLGPVPSLVLLAVPLVSPATAELYRLFLLPAGLFVVAAPATWRRPGRGLVVWLATCGVMVAYNAAIGPAFVVATLPVAVWGAIRAGWRPTLLVGVGAALLTAVAAAIPIVRLTAVDFVRFVVDNSWTNTAAHAMPWSAGAWERTPMTGVGSSQLLWEVARLSWIGVAISAAALLWRASAGGRSRRGLVPLAVGTAAVLAVTFPWTMGRIAPGVLSRPGAVSATAVGYLLPALVLLAVPARRAAGGVLVALVLIGVIRPESSTGLDPAIVSAKVTARRIVPADAVMFDGAKAGLPGVGQVVAPQPNWLADVTELGRGLKRLLRPGETYLDLTQQQALHFYLGLRVPVRYVSYVAANGRLQAAEEQQLAGRPVPAVMIGPSAWFDELPDTLRCYRLWRDYALRYVPVKVGTFTFLVDPVRAAEFAGAPPPPIGVRPPVTEGWLEALDALVRPDDLRRLPMSWGRSWPTLRARFAVVGSATVTRQATAADPWAVATVPTDRVPDGAAADFLLLHVTMTGEGPLLLQWQDVGGAWPAAAAHFVGHTGDLLVPLGAYPRWLLDKGVPAIRVSVYDASSVHSWHLDGATFLRVK